jgi:hypothetical protein
VCIYIIIIYIALFCFDLTIIIKPPQAKMSDLHILIRLQGLELSIKQREERKIGDFASKMESKAFSLL